MTSKLPESRILARGLVLIGVALVFIAAVARFPSSLGFIVYFFWSPFLLGDAFPDLMSSSWLFVACWGGQGVAIFCAWIWALRAWDRLSTRYGVAFVSVVSPCWVSIPSLPPTSTAVGSCTDARGFQ